MLLDQSLCHHHLSGIGQEVLHARQLSIAAELSELSDEEQRRARASTERWQVRLSEQLMSSFISKQGLAKMGQNVSARRKGLHAQPLGGLVARKPEWIKRCMDSLIDALLTQYIRISFSHF